MQIFYTPDIDLNPELPEEEGKHAVRVLRLTEGAQILLADGKGNFYEAAISQAHPKHCMVEILNKQEQPRLWQPHIHLAIAPTKNMDRMEWLVEKATEIG
ncbi:MAG: 16S rRNA (uracil(1498)-N(3))-methyltransferase, partial [Tannerellaceae bacterium]|nr:16S rRNA (uracil(1498)-N(3))-methyltransferase [Tannerellaceae bacterium]